MAFLKFYLKVLGLGLTIAIALVFLNMQLVSNRFLDSWVWFHNDILIPILWYWLPFIGIFMGLEIIQDRFLQKRFYPKVLKNLPSLIKYSLYIFVIVANLGLLGQALGGCIWLIPNIICGHEENIYVWGRFGADHIDTNILAVLFFTGFLISVWIGYYYYKLYIARNVIN